MDSSTTWLTAGIFAATVAQAVIAFLLWKLNSDAEAARMRTFIGGVLELIQPEPNKQMFTYGVNQRTFERHQNLNLGIFFTDDPLRFHLMRVGYFHKLRFQAKLLLQFLLGHFDGSSIVSSRLVWAVNPLYGVFEFDHVPFNDAWFHRHGS